METQDKKYQLTTTEKKLYVLGAAVFVILFLLTTIINNLLSPLTLLQVRLGIVVVGLIYNLAIYYYIHHFLAKNLKSTEIKHNEIIILFNGKELGKK